MAAGRAAASRCRADLLQRAVSHLIACAPTRNTFLTPVLPESHTLETDVAVVAGEAKTIITAHGRGPRCARFTNRRRGAPAVRVRACISRRAELSGAFLDSISVDIGTEASKPGAIRVRVTGPIDTGTESRRRGRATNVALRTVEVTIARHATINARAPFAREARQAVVTLGAWTTTRRHSHAAI